MLVFLFEFRNIISFSLTNIPIQYCLSYWFGKYLTYLYITRLTTLYSDAVAMVITFPKQREAMVTPFHGEGNFP